MYRLFKKMNAKYVSMAILFSALRVLAMLVMPTITANIIDYGVMRGDMSYIIKQGLLMLGVTVLAIVGAIIGVYFTSRESQALGETLRQEVIRKIIHFTNEDLDKYGTASLITRSSSDTMQIQFVMFHIINMLGLDPMLIIGAAVLAFWREPRLATIFLVTIPLLGLAIGVILKMAQPIFRSLQEKTDVLNRIFREGLTGIRVVRAFNKDAYEAARFDEANANFRDTSIKGHTIGAFFMPTLLLVGSLNSILIVWFGSKLVGREVMQVGNMIAFLTYASLILLGVMLLAMVLTFLPRGQIAAERVLSIVDATSSIHDPKIPVDLSDDVMTVEYRNVSFRYPGAEKLVLDDIDVTVRKGETLAVIGGTGSGKTTFANILLRLYDCTSGIVTINDKHIQRLRQHDLRSIIGFAPQKAILFSGTIRDNLRYGNTQASDEELWEALEIAQMSEFVRQLDRQLDAKVEQGGGNFSGGQRQRLSIARALVTNADILMFDDSFSALDFKTDAMLREALSKHTKDKIVIIIAQRISTVMDADTIIVLDNGKMVAKGTHDALKVQSDMYRDIMRSQMEGEEI